MNASDAAVYKRRIYLDLGIKNFESSLCWMMQNYPVKFDAIYGFECAKDLSNVQALREPIATCVEGTSAGQRGYTTNGVLNSMHLNYNYIGLDDASTTSPPTRGLSQFLLDTGVQEDDFVVVKMDVEGIEYDLLERLMADGSYKLIDEVRMTTASQMRIEYHAPPFSFDLTCISSKVFVEIHYDHPDMHRFGWSQFAHSRSDAQALLTKARDLGMYIHPWP